MLTLPKDIVQQIKDSVSMGYDQVKVGMISPKKKGVVLINKDYEVRGTFPLEYKEFIEQIVVGKYQGGGGVKKYPSQSERKNKKDNMANWFKKAIEEHKPDTLGGWRKEMPAKKRRADAVDSRPKNWSRNKKYLSAARALQALANVTTDPETKRVAKEDADYFFAKLSKKEYGGEMYHHGGNINYKKDWEVIGITMQGKKFKKIITLGRMSDEFDVKQAIKRMSGSEGIGNIREITSIRELKATGGMIEGWKGFINWLKEDF